MADGTVYAVGGDGAVHALDANGGEKRWSLRLEGEFVAPPIVADGIAYVGDEGTGSADGALYALEAETGDERERFDVGDVHGIAVADGAAYVTGRSSVAALVDPDE